MEVEHEKIERDPVAGTEEVIHTKDYVPSAATKHEVRAAKTADYIWYIVGLINTLLIVRIILLLFGANDTGFASFMYQITQPFVSLFKGIFSSPSVGSGSYFDTAALLAVVVYSLIGWGIVSLIDISSRRRLA